MAIACVSDKTWNGDSEVLLVVWFVLLLFPFPSWSSLCSEIQTTVSNSLAADTFRSPLGPFGTCVICAIGGCSSFASLLEHFAKLIRKQGGHSRN